MKNSDKIIAAFLVSLGVFSSGVAAQYVKSLSADQKMVLLMASDEASSLVPVINTNTVPVPVDK